MDQQRIVFVFSHHIKLENQYSIPFQKYVNEIISQLNQAQLKYKLSQGSVHAGIKGIRQSFEEARKALYYSNSLGISNMLIKYEDMQLHSNTSYYPSSFEQKIIMLIKNENWSECEAVFVDLWEKNNKPETFSQDQFKVLLVQLAATEFKLIDEFPFVRQAFKNSWTDIYEMNELLSSEEQFRLIMERFHLIFQQLGEHKQTETDDLKQQIIDYICDHYTSPDMSLSAVSDHYKISENYVSQLVKEATGQKFIHFVESKRMSLAKTYLVLNKMSILEISEEVGYLSVNSFCRAFKRLHSVSATAYRDLSAQS